MDILTYPKTLAHFSLEKIIDPANEKLTTFLKRTMSSIIFQHMKMVHIFQKQKRSRSFTLAAQCSKNGKNSAITQFFRLSSSQSKYAEIE